MEFAAFVAFACQQYGYTLNIKNPNGLRKMKIATTISFVIIMWTRAIRYVWIWWIMLHTFFEDENWFVLKLSGAPVILMTLFNAILVMDVTAKLLKFLPMQLKKHSEEEINEVASDAASSGTHFRRHDSFFGLSTSQKEWAKVRGAVHMGAFHHRTSKSTKRD